MVIGTWVLPYRMSHSPNWVHLVICSLRRHRGNDAKVFRSLADPSGVDLVVSRRIANWRIRILQRLSSRAVVSATKSQENELPGGTAPNFTPYRWQETSHDRKMTPNVAVVYSLGYSLDRTDMACARSPRQHGWKCQRRLVEHNGAPFEIGYCCRHISMSNFQAVPTRNIFRGSTPRHDLTKTFNSFIS